MINFCQCSHGTFAPASTGSLLNRHRWWNTANGIDIRARRRLHKLTRIGIQRFQVTTLAFTKDNIKGHSTFTAATHPGNNRKLISRNGDIHTFQIMLAGIVNLNAIIGR